MSGARIWSPNKPLDHGVRGIARPGRFTLELRLLGFAGALALGAAGTPAAAGQTTRVSVDSSGTQANDGSGSPAISGDGRYVAFTSDATNLDGADANGFTSDIYVHDRQTGATTRVSVDSSGAQANDASESPAISGDGRYVAFASRATNLDAADANGSTIDIYVHDRQTGATTRVSVDSNGTQGNDRSQRPAISGDGRYVAFDSDATNLDGIDTNGTTDIYVHDRQSGQTTQVNVDSSGTQANEGSQGPAISGNGRYVAFRSAATNLDSTDTNGVSDIYVHDQQTGQTVRVSDSAQSDAGSAHPAINSDARYIAFMSDDSGDTNDINVHDRQTGATARVSVNSSGTPANGFSVQPAITGDGRYVAFVSEATNLAGPDSNGLPAIYVHDRQTGATTRVSVDSSGAQANGISTQAAISGDGRFVAFTSDATNLDDADTNETGDVYVHEFGVADTDGDGIADDEDNCPDDANPNQLDTDDDGDGDACDADDDNDTVADASDNCPLDANTNQADADGDGAGNACDADLDGDGVIDAADACVPTQTGAVVNAHGCSIADLVPCDSPWRNHGAYVSAIIRTADEFLDLGLISEAERADIVAAAGQSQCGQ